MDADLDLMTSITRQSSQQITGEGTQARGSNTSLDISVNNTDQVISSHIPLSALAKPSIKADIWANKYVDLAALLSPDQQTSYELVCEQPESEGDSMPHFKWTQKKGDWAMYDTKFCKLKELQPQLGWQTVQNELYQEARLELVQGEGSNFRNDIFNPKRGRSRNSYEGKSYERYSEGTSSFTKGYRA